MTYASQTSVSPEKTQADIQRTLMRYGADSFGVMQRRESALVQFEFKHLCVEIQVPLPGMHDREFTHTDAGRPRKPNQRRIAYEQAVRSRWRALLLAIKAKLEAVDCGISTIEQEFMPFIVVGNGQVLGDVILPRIEEAAKNGRPFLLENLP